MRFVDLTVRSYWRHCMFVLILGSPHPILLLRTDDVTVVRATNCGVMVNGEQMSINKRVFNNWDTSH